MKELRLKLKKDITKLSSADRRRALKKALDDELKKLQAKEKAYAKLKTVFRSVARSTGIEIDNTTELVRLLLPYTSPAFKARIGYRAVDVENSNGSPSVSRRRKKKRTRRSNNVKKTETDGKGSRSNQEGENSQRRKSASHPVPRIPERIYLILLFAESKVSTCVKSRKMPVLESARIPQLHWG